MSKELAEFHFIDATTNIKSFIDELKRILDLRKNELHRVKIIASRLSSHDRGGKTFFVLINDAHFYHALEQKSDYQGSWRWKIEFNRKPALLFTPPRGNSGFISVNLDCNEKRKELAVKNSTLGFSLFDMLEAIKQRIPTLLEDIEHISLTRDLIFIQMSEPVYATLLMKELDGEFEVTWAHSRGYIVSVDNYPIKFNNK